MKERATGFDLARTLAIFGMVIVNFKIAMNATTGSSVLMSFSEIFEGRASALFVILAGVGVTFLTNKARASIDSSVILNGRLSLLKRGLLLIFFGLIYTPIWPADILHFYGFYFLIASLIFRVNDKTLLLISLIIMLVFPSLLIFFNYEQNWDWQSLTYENFWSVDGMIRHIIFNGFHPVFPWAAFLVFGIWLGRQDLTEKVTKNRLLISSAMIFIIIESLFYWLRLTFADGVSLGMTSEEATFLLSTSIIPPLPQYIISATSSAVIVIIACVYVSDMFAKNKLLKWLAQTGQLSLTLYVAHVIFGMGLLESMGWLTNQTIDFSLFSALTFSVCAIFFSVIWLKYFKSGPLEWLFRRVSR
ncbi:DUF418 domain-containing protein [Colwelliaceae bacterium 6441]